MRVYDVLKSNQIFKNYLRPFGRSQFSEVSRTNQNASQKLNFGLRSSLQGCLCCQPSQCGVMLLTSTDYSVSPKAIVMRSDVGKSRENPLHCGGSRVKPPLLNDPCSYRQPRIIYRIILSCSITTIRGILVQCAKKYANSCTSEHARTGKL